MASVHGLQHIQGLPAPDLTNDDPVRPHPQAVTYQVALAHLTLTFNVWGRVSRRTTWGC